MNYQRLEKNLIDNILEAQIKLGYDGRPMSLNYTNSSLHHLTGAENIDDMLKGFSEYTQSRLGQLAFRSIKDGVCITVPSEGTAYVHENTDKNGFISRFIDTVRSHTTVEKVLDVFREFSDEVEIKETDNEEFQYLVYFRNGIPDDYRYCLTVEEEIDGSSHITYHRFIEEDYNDLGF